MKPISAVIITFNEEDNIGRCIDSVKNIADEVLVLDSFSTDSTVAIAREKGAKVIQQAFAGYIAQKNDAVQLAANDWVLCLDADEALDETLQASVGNADLADGSIAYGMNRCTNYCGKFIRHGSWYPDRKLRLFNRLSGEWGGVNPHDQVIVKTGVKEVQLPGDLLHYSYNSIEEHVAQNNRFSTISAESYFKRGKRASIPGLIVRPAWAFFRSFVLRLGFLDGFYGFVIAKNIGHLTFLKYSKLYRLQAGSR